MPKGKDGAYFAKLKMPSCIVAGCKTPATWGRFTDPHNISLGGNKLMACYCYKHKKQAKVKLEKAIAKTRAYCEKRKEKRAKRG